MAEAVQLRLPPKLVPVFNPARGALQYRGAYGGRGSAKSRTFATMAATWGLVEPLRILCAREFHASIKESFHAELREAIESTPWLAPHYDIGVDYLRGSNGTEFIFRGLRHNSRSIRSLANIDLTIVEEGEDIPETSWRALLATVLRRPRSECWVIWNPEREGSATDKRFRAAPPPRSMIVEINHGDNPWFPPGLEELRQHDLRTLDPEVYAWIWEGAYRKESDAQIFRGKIEVRDFEAAEGWAGPYYGLDFGFSTDPTAAVRCWIHDGALWIDHEANKVGLELDATAAYLIERIPGIAQHTVRADSARPESISYLKRHGLPGIVGAKKGKGSVQDGIEHLRSYRKIYLHPRCREARVQFLGYSYKTDKLTGDVLPEILDALNHIPDAVRYALEPLIRRRAGVMISRA